MYMLYMYMGMCYGHIMCMRLYMGMCMYIRMHMDISVWHAIAGQDDIETTTAAIRQRGALLPALSPRLLPFPLYAALPPSMQLRALRTAPVGARKVRHQHVPRPPRRP